MPDPTPPSTVDITIRIPICSGTQSGQESTDPESKGPGPSILPCSIVVRVSTGSAPATVSGISSVKVEFCVPDPALAGTWKVHATRFTNNHGFAALGVDAGSYLVRVAASQNNPNPLGTKSNSGTTEFEPTTDGSYKTYDYEFNYN